MLYPGLSYRKVFSLSISLCGPPKLDAKDEQAGESGREDHRRFAKRIVPAVVGQNCRDKIRRTCVMVTVFDVVWRDVGCSRGVGVAYAR